MEGEVAAARSGVAHADLLLAYADALVGEDDTVLGPSRAELLRGVGAGGLVDAAAVVANFERMVRIADATGIPLDAPLSVLGADLARELGLLRYGSAANTPAAGLLARGLGRLLQPLTQGALLLAGRVARGRRR